MILSVPETKTSDLYLVHDQDQFRQWVRLHQSPMLSALDNRFQVQFPSSQN